MMTVAQMVEHIQTEILPLDKEKQKEFIDDLIAELEGLSAALDDELQEDEDSD